MKNSCRIKKCSKNCQKNLFKPPGSYLQNQEDSGLFMSTKNIDTEEVKPWEKQPKKVTICFKTCFWRWKSWKSEKLRAHSFIQLLKVSTGGHFQDSNYMIWFKHPGFFLVPFYAPGPFMISGESYANELKFFSSRTLVAKALKVKKSDLPIVLNWI